MVHRRLSEMRSAGRLFSIISRINAYKMCGNSRAIIHTFRLNVVARIVYLHYNDFVGFLVGQVEPLLVCIVLGEVCLPGILAPDEVTRY